MKFASKNKPTTGIPTASMADIAFLLLIFFMVSTVFVRFRGIDVMLPDAQSSAKIEDKRKNIVSVWVSSRGKICIDDIMLDLSQVATVIGAKLAQNPEAVISVKADKFTRYGTLEGVFEELKEGNALQVNLAATKERL